MAGSFYHITYRRVRTWKLDDGADLPLPGQIPTETLCSYKQTIWPVGTPAPSLDVPIAALPTASPSASVPPMSSLGYSAIWRRRMIPSSQNAAPFADPGTPPDDPFTPPADSDMGFSFQPLGASSAAGMASSPIDPNAQVPDNFYPAPQESSVSGQLSSSTSVNTSPTSNTESLDRIRSVPVLLSVTYVHGHSRGSINCHYLLPPPPEVDPIHLNGGRVVPGPSMLLVSDDAREGLLRDAWLDIGMDVVWEELMMSLIAEYAGAIGDIGLSVWEWRWVKTEWNMEALNPQASLRDIIELFLLTNPAAGTPLILSPVLGDDIPYSNQPSVEFEVPVVPENSYPEEEISQGNNTEFMIQDMEQNQSDEDMGDEVDSPGTLAHPSPIAEELEFEDPIGGASSSIGEPVDTGNPGSSHLPLPAYWIRTGNSFMLIGESREECEMIMGARGVECRFLQYSGR